MQTGEAGFEWNEETDRDELFHQCVNDLEYNGEEEDPYFLAPEFQGKEDHRIRDKLVQMRDATGPHPGMNNNMSFLFTFFL